MMKLSLKYDLKPADPEATAWISWESIEQAHLSIACRAARNRTALYQRKHGDAGLATRERDPELAALNRSISEHYELLQKQRGSLGTRRVMAFPISDLTANPLRPHYDASVPPDQRAFQSNQAEQTVYRNGSDARLFHLEDEPIGEVPYTLLLCYEEKNQTRFAIHHQVMVKPDGSLPEQTPVTIRKGLKWWAACPPLLIDGKHLLEQFAVLDYDLRHLFGFPKGSDEEKEAQEAFLRSMYGSFPDWEAWCETIHQKLSELKSLEMGYHAALGISEQELILVHRYTTIPRLAEELKSLDAQEAVLLDSGGSCAIWANWGNGGQGGVLASHWNFRPDRGAVVFLVLKGKRYPKDVDK